MFSRRSTAKTAIARAMHLAANGVVADLLPRGTSAPPITAQIGQAIENDLNGQRFGLHQTQVACVECPEYDPALPGGPSGATLYIGLSASHRRTYETRGMLIHPRVLPDPSTDAPWPDLDLDCRRMLARTDAAFVWLYMVSGIRVIPAADVMARGPRDLLSLAYLSVEELFARTLEGLRGDKGMGLPRGPAPEMTLRRTLGQVLDDLKVPHAIGLTFSR